AVPEDVIWQICSYLATHPSCFAGLPQTPELFLTLLYVYYNLMSNTILRQLLKRNVQIRRKEFSGLFRIKGISLNYHLDRILSANLGFHQIEHLGIDYFFHDSDEIGSELNRYVDGFINHHLIKRQFSEESEPLPLQEFVESVTRVFVDEKKVIPSFLKRPFELFAWDFVGKYCIEHGVPSDLLPDLPDRGPFFTPLGVEDVRGRCSRCGNWVLQGSPQCDRCQLIIDQSKLTMDLVEAIEVWTSTEKKLQREGIVCPNCKRTYLEEWGWETCFCGADLTRQSGD
ncbi:MAG: hypothetical protein ACTSU5_18575, partial [Promethearchaeota archaeon]